MKYKLLSIALLLSPAAHAQEISAPPPVKLLLLPHNKIFEGNPSRGPHGLEQYCYKKNDIYVIYSKNLLGGGYTFTKDEPKQKCIVSMSEISTNNMLGLTVGVTQAKASQLLGKKLSDGSNTFTWLYQRPIHNLPYDDMTTLNITIKYGFVYAVNLFNTVTN